MAQEKGFVDKAVDLYNKVDKHPVGNAALNALKKGAGALFSGIFKGRAGAESQGGGFGFFGK